MRPVADFSENRYYWAMGAARQKSSAFSFAVGATALLLVSCTNGQHQVSGHRYDVPVAYLIPGSSFPFFLPEPKDEGFLFILNPEADLRRRILVVVEGRAEVCRRANGSGYVSKTICSPKPIEWQGHEWLRNGDDTFWTYSPNTSSGANTPFISCFKMETEGRSGLCSATLGVDDLALTIKLKDDEIPALEATFQKAMAMLRSWES
ncbi:hypothetical protein ACLBV5_05000 [Brevundimonas sp. M1A4_2e]